MNVTPFDYTELKTDAQEMIREFGQMMVLSRTVADPDAPPAGPDGDYDPVTGITYNPTTGVNDPTLQEDTPFYGVAIAPTEEYTQSVGAQNVQLRDMLIYMEPGVIEPRLSDAVVFSSDEVWQIVNKVEVSPSGDDVLYILQVRP